MTTVTTAADARLEWQRRWSDALALWSRFTRLREPQLCTTTEQANRSGLDGSFAMIRLTDQLVVIDLQQVIMRNLVDLPLEIMGHEIGHHILCPANLTDQARMLARMRWALPGVEGAAPAVANLYADLHINDRLQRGSGLRMDEVYRRLKAHAPTDRSATCGASTSASTRSCGHCAAATWPRSAARPDRRRRPAGKSAGACLPFGLARRGRRVRRSMPAVSGPRP
ncbi:hypothetical protein BZL30_7638 [Mycobacterium kansasii]|uniref:Uncharacterized protein n=1 Tax=Mycobacterium kansasii TaxID=1768 RepID=A0A1V3WLL3_MYCKA|nr:hypothetical protein BZL30_7638 [Mycobacterium kansasii]